MSNAALLRSAVLLVFDPANVLVLPFNLEAVGENDETAAVVLEGTNAGLVLLAHDCRCGFQRSTLPICQHCVLPSQKYKVSLLRGPSGLL